MLLAWQPGKVPGRIKDLQEFRDIKHSNFFKGTSDKFKQIKLSLTELCWHFKLSPGYHNAEQAAPSERKLLQEWQKGSWAQPNLTNIRLVFPHCPSSDWNREQR